MSDATPPIDDPMLAPEPAAWPKHVGLISIIWAALGLTCGGCGVIGIAMQPMFKNMVPPEQQAQMVQPPMSPGALPFLLIGAALSVLLLVAGIMTLRRNPTGRMLHLAWAGLILLVIVGSIVDAVLHMPTMEKWVADNPNVPSAKFVNKQAMMLQTVGISALRIIWPVFCLIWFGLVKRTAASFGSAPAGTDDGAGV